MTHGKTYNKSPRRINHKATKSKTNTGTTTLDFNANFNIKSQVRDFDIKANGVVHVRGIAE